MYRIMKTIVQEGLVSVQTESEFTWNSPRFVDRQLSGSMLPFELSRAQVA